MNHEINQDDETSYYEGNPAVFGWIVGQVRGPCDLGAIYGLPDFAGQLSRPKGSVTTYKQRTVRFLGLGLDMPLASPPEPAREAVIESPQKDLREPSTAKRRWRKWSELTPEQKARKYETNRIRLARIRAERAQAEFSNHPGWTNK